MNILSICPAIPAKDAKGYQVQAYYRVRHLSRNHNVSVVCFGQGGDDEKNRLALTSIGIRVRMLPWRRRDALCEVIKAFFDDEMPFQCALFTSAAFRAALDEIVQETKPDVIHLTTIRVLPNLSGRVEPLVLDFVDSMGLNFRRRTEQAPWWSRPIWKIEQIRVSRYEKFAAVHALASFVVSSVDRQEMGGSSVNVLPLGIDGECYNRGRPSKNPVVVFTGNMSYRPNIEAAIWFATKCWPSIIAVVPGATFVIAGSRPAPSVCKLANDLTIRVTGRVPSVADVIRGAQVAVAPMQSGSGMQFKVLEAMACGIPVIVSALGLGDIKATPKKDIITANTPDEFISSTIQLLTSSDLRAEVGEFGYSYVSSYHTWNSINASFERTIIDAISKK
jgi:glycosyltransferase involved in cell wall biosynthesis